MSFTRIYVFNETKPAQETFSSENSFKIVNPDSAIFENVWSRNKRNNLNNEI